MSERKAFLLRIDPRLLDAVQRWANDDLRSLNAQIEFLLRRALQDAGRTSAAPGGRGRGLTRTHQAAAHAPRAAAHARVPAGGSAISNQSARCASMLVDS